MARRYGHVVASGDGTDAIRVPTMAENDAKQAKTSNPYGFLRRGHVKFQMIRASAEGVETRELAKRFNSSVSAVNAFRRDFAEEIERVRADLDNELAGLWSAEKRQRIASYEQNVADCELLIVRELAKGEGSEIERENRDGTLERVIVGGADPDVIAKMTKAKDRALRAIAEELGQLPSRVRINVTGERTEMHIGGDVDLDQL